MLKDRGNDSQLSSNNFVPWSRSCNRMKDKMDYPRQLYKCRRLGENHIRENRLKALVHNLLAVRVKEKPFEIETTDDIRQFHRRNFVKNLTYWGRSSENLDKTLSPSQRSVHSNVQYSWMTRTVGIWSLMTRLISLFRSRAPKGWGTVLIQSTSFKAVETRRCLDTADRKISTRNVSQDKTNKLTNRYLLSSVEIDLNFGAALDS